MSPDEAITVEKKVTVRYVVDCPLCPYREDFPAAAVAYYERGKHERMHDECPSNET